MRNNYIRVINWEGDGDMMYISLDVVIEGRMHTLTHDDETNRYSWKATMHEAKKWASGRGLLLGRKLPEYAEEYRFSPRVWNIPLCPQPANEIRLGHF